MCALPVIAVLNVNGAFRVIAALPTLGTEPSDSARTYDALYGERTSDRE